MDLEALTRDLFRMPDPEGPEDTCPGCMTRGNAPVAFNRVPNGIQCAYTCTACAYEWACSWWEGVS